MAKHACPFVALLDSGLSHCFVDEVFASQNRLTNLPNPILLQLFDGSALSSVSKLTLMPITFSTGETHQINCYITKLDKGYTAILGYNWLVQHNPRIDWAKTKVMFSQTLTKSPAVTIPNQTPLHTPPSEKKPMIDIRLINARNFTRLSRQKGNALFLARPDPSSDTTISARSNNTNPTSLLHTPTDTSSKIPPEYHEFLDVFSGERANQLPPHRSYDLRINLEEGSKPT